MLRACPTVVRPNDKIAAKYKGLIDPIKNAVSHIQIYDDGNDDGNSVYNDPEVIEALKSRMAECDTLKVEIHFNCRARLAVNAIAQEYPDRFSILYRQDEMQRRPDNWHFKLYDEGLYCYASYHQFESEKRKYVVYRKGVGDNFVDVDEFVASFANQRCSGKYVGQA